MQYLNVLLLSKDNILSNTLQTRISNLFLSNILEGAKNTSFFKNHSLANRPCKDRVLDKPDGKFPP
jgi:hypothetical protein